MSPREEALARIAAIAAEHGITAAEINAHLSSAQDDSEPERKSSILTKLLSYLGGIFVLAGLGVFVEMQWSEMNSAARIVITLGSGIAAFVMAWIVESDPRREAVATPLYLAAALLQPVGILVALDELSTGGDERYAFLVASGAVLAQQVATFIARRRTSVLFVAMLLALWFYATAMDLVGLDGELIAFSLGLAILVFLRWADHTPHASITPFWYLCGSAVMLAGLFSLVEGTPLEVLFLGVACGLVFWSTWVKSRGLLATATIGILSYVGYFTAEHFADTVGWPLALIAFGLALIGLSMVAYRINRKYIAAG